MSTPEQALHHLLVANFTAEQLRRILTHRFGRGLLAELPGAGVPLVDFVFAATGHLERQRLIGESLFAAIADENPGIHAEVCRVAVLFGVLPPRLDPQPGKQPSGPPPPFIVDWPRLPTFTGRETLLEELHRLLTGPADRTPRHVLLRGLGGTGKTQVVVEYAHRHHRHHRGGVYWINAARDWKDELAAIAMRLGLAPPARQDGDQTTQWIIAFERHLREQCGDALIIVDNVEAPHDVMRREIGPKLTLTALSATLLVTTRLWELPQGFTDVPLDVLPLADARTILQAGADARADDTDLDTICRWLGCLPLAVCLAAAALKKLDDMPIASFLRHLHESGIDRLADEAGLGQDTSGLHQARVNAVLDWHWARLTDDNTHTLMAMAAAYADGTPLPLARLRVLSGLADDPRALPSQRPFKRALEELQRANLIQSVGVRRVRLHSLVRAYVRRTVDWSACLTEGAARMLAAYRAPDTLDGHAAERDFAEIVGDLHETAVVMPGTGTHVAEIRHTAWMFGLEAHHVRRTLISEVPTYLIQHIRERAHHQSDDALSTACDTWLAGRAHLRSAPAWRTPVDPALIRVFEAHSESVNRVSLMPCGTRALSASKDGTARVWDLERGDTLRILKGHDGDVTDVIALPDGRRAVSASADGTLRLWDLESGATIRVFSGHRRRVNRLAISADGRRLLSAASDRTIGLWDVERDDMVGVLRGHREAVIAVVVLPGGDQALSASADRTLRVWDLRYGRLLRTFPTPGGLVTDLALIPGRHELLAASADGVARLWDPRTNQVLGTYEGHSDELLGVSASPDGRRVLSAGRDNTVRMWELASRRLLRTFSGHSGRVFAALGLPDGDRAISASWDNTLRLWNLRAEPPPPASEGHVGAWVRGLAGFPDGQRAASASSDFTLRIWDLANGRSLRTLRGHTGKVNSVAVLPDGHRLISASADATMRLWDANDARVLRTFAGHTGRVNRVLVLPGGRQALSASWDKTIRLWDLASSAPLRAFTGHTGWVMGLALVGNNRLLSSSADHTLRMWDLAGGQTIRVYEGHDDLVTCVATTADGKRALSGSRDGTLRLWDLSSGRTLRVLRGHGHWLNEVVLLAAGRLALSASEDRTLRLWELDSGVTRVILHLEETPHAIAALPGDRIVVGGASGQVRVLRVSA